MMINNRNRIHVTFLRNFLDQLRHVPVVVNLLFFLLITSNITAAQPPPAPPSWEPLPVQPNFNPSLALLMLLIVGAFFCMGFLSIYIRRCAERRYNTGGHRHVIHSAALRGGGRFSRRGLDAAVIGTFPTFLYSTVKGHKIGKTALECAVCLNEFEDDETLRLIPKCCHVFHPDCIDAWLASKTTCPVCRANLVPNPGDVPFDTNTLFEPEQQQQGLDNDEAQNDFSIRVSDESNGNGGSAPAPNRPPRSWSTGWRLGNLFPKSRSTGRLLVQPGENMDRFTLRLPDEIRYQLLNTHLNRTKSCVAFPRATSSKRGYRSRSGGRWHSKNYYYYERFDHESQQTTDQIDVPMNLPKSGSNESSKVEMNNVKQPKSLLKSIKSIKSPLDGLYGLDNKKYSGGETSLDRLMSDDVVVKDNDFV